MLHITSFMQKIAKLNNKNTIPTTNAGTLSSSLNTHLNRNNSFVYDHNLKSYVYEYNNDDDITEHEHLSYWGYLRDKNADRKLNTSAPLASNNTKKKEFTSKQADSSDAYWGLFKDTHLTLDDLDRASVSSSPSRTFSLSSSINSLSRFKDTETAEASAHDSDFKSASYCETTRLDFDYKTSKFKIEARKRDADKILIQSLEDKEALFKKETIKSFDSNYLLNLENRKSTSSSSLSSFKYSTKLKDISFLHFSTSQLASASSKCNFNKFKNIFNTVSKLNKTINVFNGDFLHDITNKTDIPLLNSVHASLYDLSGLIRNYTNSNELTKKTTAVSLCSNVFEFQLTKASSCEKIFGYDNHSTMLFEFQNVKIGFMALLDKHIFEKLNKLISTKSNGAQASETVMFSNDYDEEDVTNENETIIEYVDYLEEANRLSKQLRACGANVIVCLVNMENEQSEQRLLREANDLDLIFSSYNASSCAAQPANKIDLKKNCFNNRYLIKTEANYDCLSLVTLRLDEFNSNQVADISIHKYIVD